MAEDSDVSTPPAGSVPLAIAVLATDPASTSACLTVYAYSGQVAVAPGASDSTQGSESSPRVGSSIVTGASGT